MAIEDLNDPSRGVSANVGTLRGGVAVNVLAPTCTMEFEVRHAVDVDPDEVLADLLARVVAVDARLSAFGGHATTEEFIRYPALATDPEIKAVASVKALVGRGEPGPVGFGTEAGLYSDRLATPAVIVGPGDIADAHRPDEHVAPDQLDRCIDVLRRTVDSFCINPETGGTP